MSDAEKTRGLIGCQGHLIDGCYFCYLTRQRIENSRGKCYVDSDTWRECQIVQDPLFEELLPKGNHKQ